MNRLYLVAMPIGNDGDITFRALEILKNADVIYGEDTRNARKQLSRYGIETHLKSFHKFNERERVKEIVCDLKAGKTIALITDAGYPGISDPGYLACRKAIDAGCEVTSVPGASAFLSALVASGLPCERFYFHGFLHHIKTAKKRELEKLADFGETMVFYESPLRLKETVLLMKDVFGNRHVCIGRELTKKYEEFIRFDLDEAEKTDLDLKGEIVIVCEGAEKSRLARTLEKETVREHWEYYRNLGLSENEAMKKTAADRNVSKSIIYAEIKKKS